MSVERHLAAQLKRIFDLDKVTFDRPGESQEQEAAFVEVSTAVVRIKDGREVARVTGTLRVFAAANKMPFGYFAKKIDAADPADTAGLMFYNFEENRGTFLNVVERSLEFTYLFDGQYDPAIGTLNQINLTISESE